MTLSLTKRLVKGSPLSAVENDANLSAIETEVNGKVATGDSRLSDARAPTSHTQAISTITGLQAELDAKALDADLDALTTTVSGKVATGDSRLTDRRAIAEGDYGGIVVDSGGIVELDGDAVRAALATEPLADPDGDRIMFWDESAGTGGSLGYLATGTGLTISGTTISVDTIIPQNSKSAAYTLVLGDAGKHILHPSADTTARIFTIPANSSVAFPIGTAVTFVNQNSGGVITIAITTDTMRLAGAGTTGSRTLAANGIATAIKLTSTEWIISGTGLT
jgi:hypothetical protein